MKILRKVFVLIFVFLCLFDRTFQVESQNASSIRLPTAIQPIKYNLHITSGIHDNILNFTGKVVIEIVVKESTNEIVLHAKELRDLVIILVDLGKNRRYEDVKFSLEKEKDFLRISAPKRLNSGELYRLEIRYVGNIQENNYTGIYKTTYLDDFYNQSIPLAVTQFEPTGARLAFPCFDEPAFRAKFTIKITHGSFYSALSNMPIEGYPSWNGNMITTIFRESPAMPTYLVGFVICNFNYISELANGIEHRVFFPPNAEDLGARAITNSIQSVAFLEKYLEIDYFLPKLDHIHVKDQESTAISWGLGIYKDDEFLQTLEDRNDTVSRMITQNNFISQQWFSNLVPPKWWSSAWVNAGLGTYYGYIITDLVYPMWKMENYFLLEEIKDLMVMAVDEKKPLFRDVNSEAEIQEVTSDDLVYRKGAGILKMFHHAIGNETFIKGLQIYLNKNKNSNTDEEDFFRAMQSAIHEDYLYLFQNDKSLPEIMKSWTHNVGLPILKVTRHNSGRITIQQRPKHETNTFSKWWIPLNFATASNGNFTRTTADYIMPPESQVNLDLEEINVSLDNKDWLILNKQQTGLYYVIYDDQNLDLIAQALNEDHRVIHPLNRALLFRDLRLIVDTDLGKIKPVLSALRYIKHERESMPWFEASELLKEILYRLEGSKSHDSFKDFIREIMQDFFHYFFQVPFYKLSFADSIVKKSIFRFACDVDVPECLQLAKHQYKEYFYYKWPMDESVKAFTACKALQAASGDEITEMMKKALHTNMTARDETDFVLALECIKLEENVKIVAGMIHEYKKKKFASAIANRIHGFMEMFHPLYKEPGTEKTKRKVNLEFFKVSKEKRELFQEKYGNDISNWLAGVK